MTCCLQRCREGLSNTAPMVIEADLNKFDHETCGVFSGSNKILFLDPFSVENCYSHCHVLGQNGKSLDPEKQKQIGRLDFFVQGRAPEFCLVGLL